MSERISLRFREANADFVERLHLARPYSTLLQSIAVIDESIIKRGFKRDLAHVELSIDAHALATVFERHCVIGEEISAEYAIAAEVEAVLRANSLAEYGEPEDPIDRTPELLRRHFEDAHDAIPARLAEPVTEPWVRLVLDPVGPDFAENLRRAQLFSFSLRQVRVIAAEKRQLGARAGLSVTLLCAPEFMALCEAEAHNTGWPLENIAASYLHQVTTRVLMHRDPEHIPF